MPNDNAFLKKTAKFEAVIQCALLPSEPDLVVAYIATPEDLLEMQAILLDTGYEVSCRKDEKRGNFSVCIKGVHPDCQNAGKWLYGNADSQHLAYCSAFFKHFAIYDGGKWIDRTAAGQSGLS